MSSILIVEKNPDLERLYVLNLRTYVGVDEIETKSLAKFVPAYLDGGKLPDLILVRDKIDKETTALDVIKALRERKLDIPIVIIGERDKIKKTPQIHFVSNGFSLKNIVKTVASVFNVTATEMIQKEVPDFYPIPIKYFRAISTTNCNIYALSTDALGSPYELKFEMGAAIDREAIQDLIREGQADLFVDKSERLRFVNHITETVCDNIDYTNLNIEEKLFVVATSTKEIAAELQSTGVTEETIEKAVQNIEQVMEASQQDTQVLSLLKKLMSNSGGYLFKHVQLVTFLTHQMAQNMEWVTAEHEKTLAFMAYFHDILLENDELARIHSDKDLREANLSEEQKQLVLNHAKEAAQLVQGFSDAPMGVGILISQHHGALDGVGFVDHYSANISSLSLLFIIAEEYARQLLSSEDVKTVNPEQLFMNVKAKFGSKRLAKYIEALEQTVLSTKKMKKTA